MSVALQRRDLSSGGDVADRRPLAPKPQDWLLQDTRSGDVLCAAGGEAASIGPDNDRVGRPRWRRAGARMGRGDAWGWTIVAGVARFETMRARVERADRIRRRDAYGLGRIQEALARELAILMAMGSRFGLDTVDEITRVRTLSGDVVSEAEQHAARQAAMSTVKRSDLIPRPAITAPAVQLALRTMYRDVAIIHDILASSALSRSPQGVQTIESLRARFGAMDKDAKLAILGSFDWSMGESDWFTSFVTRSSLDMRVLEERYKAAQAASCCGCG